VAHVLAGFDELVPHPDVAAGLTTLQRARIPAVALTNGSGQLTRAALERSGLAGLVAAVHDVGEVGRWKPAPDPYRFVLDRRGVVPAAAAMVAAHPWDLLGAEAAGLVTAWLDRDATTGYPEAFGHPTFRAATLDGLAHQLVERGRT
jgi:2-haloacid dehalogenase